MARPDDKVAKPHHREKAIKVAAMMMAGSTQKEAAEAAGVGVRTVHRWCASDFWEGIQEEARTQYMSDLEAYCLRAVIDAVKDGDANLALKVLERIDPKVWGPKTGTNVIVDVTDPPAADGDELVARGRRVLVALATPALPE